MLFMHKQSHIEELLKKSCIRTRLHKAPVFKLYKPNNEKVKQNVLYRGAMKWNSLPAKDRNNYFKDFKKGLLRDQFV